jgi:hypothetical protein
VGFHSSEHASWLKVKATQTIRHLAEPQISQKALVRVPWLKREKHTMAAAGRVIEGLEARVNEAVVRRGSQDPWRIH